MLSLRRGYSMISNERRDSRCSRLIGRCGCLHFFLQTFNVFVKVESVGLFELLGVSDVWHKLVKRTYLKLKKLQATIDRAHEVEVAACGLTTSRRPEAQLLLDGGVQKHAVRTVSSHE